MSCVGQAGDWSACPSARLARPYSFVQRPGELLFIPANSPHQVKNLDRTLAVSMNYVDHTNLETSIRELAFSGAVSYTHLTLPTKRIVEISGVAGSLKKKKKKMKKVNMYTETTEHKMRTIG
eukprot:TRINITY_DN24337_c0_g1_i1.p1 TRINITY_DN24337_c0_g1~~TRINITY_DN24337_c0_g1_i1.p1  ORF type:complete len:122 (-),score=15.31 TRINITY_DN24337_c0_g1_i1:23-388(-)